MDRTLNPVKWLAPIRSLKNYPLLFVFLCLLSGYTAMLKDPGFSADGTNGTAGISITYPQDGTLFPPEMPAPEFLWANQTHSSTAQAKYRISVSTQKNGTIFTRTVNTSSWRPDSTTWQEIKRFSDFGPVLFQVADETSGRSEKNPLSTGVNFSFSTDSVGASVFFRAVPLPFIHAVKNVGEIEWYLGNISGGRPRKILGDVPVCANCHSFSRDGSQFAMDVDYGNDKGSYIISHMDDTVQLTFEKIITWSDFKKEDEDKTFGLLSQISPDGRYVLSTVKDRSIFVPLDNLEYSQLFFPIKGIIAVYDREKKQFFALPGASDESLVQSNPNWSPDGKEIIFSRASRYRSEKIDHSQDVMVRQEDAMEFISGQKGFKFDLYRLEFNDGRGGVARPVEGASDNKVSNYFARYSPDRKWIVFCQSENFMLLQPDSKLYIMPAQGGTPRLMNCNTGNMNSWHSWSPDGKWMVFSSKNKGPYTQLYLTHIDEKGNDSPAVLLENMVFENKAANIPEFFDCRKINLLKINDSFSKSALYYTSQAANDFESNNLKSALENLERAIKIDSTYIDAYIRRLTVYTRLGQTGSKNFLSDHKTAMRLINRQLAKEPNDVVNILRRGNLYYSMGNYPDAEKDGLTAVKVNPEDFESYFLLASVYQKTGETQKIFNCYEKMLKIRPGDKQTTYFLALLYQRTGKIAQANQMLGELINKYPNDVSFYFSRANLLFLKGDKIGAKSDLDKAVQQNPESFEVYLKRGFFFKETGQKEMAVSDFKKAVGLLTDYMNKNPENITLLAFRPEVLEQIGDFEGALADYNKYLTLMPLNYKALRQKARIEFSQKYWSKAVDSYTLLINNYPAEAEFFFRRSQACMELGKGPQALSDMDKASELSPGDHSILYHLASMKSRMGDRIGAKKDLQTIITLLSEKKKTNSLNEHETKLLSVVSEQIKQLN